MRRSSHCGVSGVKNRSRVSAGVRMNGRRLSWRFAATKAGGWRAASRAAGLNIPPTGIEAISTAA